jgi:Fe-S-cluster containining protein
MSARGPSSWVPALRAEVQAKRYGKRLVLEDHERLVRVPVDELGVRIASALAEAPRAPDGLVAMLKAPRAAVFERVVLMNRQLLLDTPRARGSLELRRAAAPPPGPAAPAAEVPLQYPEGLAHGCIACGSCCSGTDLGPLRAADVENIRSFDWGPHLPADVTSEDWFQELEGPQGASITLLGQRHGRCVFLGPDKLCTIHKVRGAATKPTICRQFPYQFVRTPDGIQVSFSMECRSWWQARQRGRPVREDEAGVRGLLAEGAPVVEVPNPVPVWDGLEWSWGRWLEVRGELLAAAKGAASPAAMLEELAQVTYRAFASSMDSHRDEERFALPEAWGLPEAPARAQEDLTVELERRFLGDLEDLARRYRTVGDDANAERLERLGWGVRYVLRRKPLEDLARCPEETEIWRDLALAALYAHEPVRRGDLLTGMALLVLQVLTGHRLAALTARATLRGRTAEQDVVDAMVLVTKLLRGSAVLASLMGLREALVPLFVFNPTGFTR